MKNTRRQGLASTVSAQIEVLENRCLLAAVSVDPRDVTTSINDIKGAVFQPERRVGYVPLNFELKSSAHGKTETERINSANRADYFHTGETLSAQVLVTARGTVRGRVDRVSAYAATGVVQDATDAHGVKADNSERYATAVISISGWGYLDLQIQGQAITTRVWDYIATTSSSDYLEGETEVQTSTGNYTVTASGYFNFQFSVEASRHKLNFNLANTGDGQDNARVQKADVETAVRVEATQFNLEGKSTTDTNHQYVLNADTTTYASHGVVNIVASGLGSVSNQLYATSHNVNGYTKDGWVRDNEYAAHTSLWHDPTVQGRVEVNLDANYIKSQRSWMGTWTLDMDPTVKTAEVTARDYLLANQAALDRLWQDYDQLSAVL